MKSGVTFILAILVIAVILFIVWQLLGGQLDRIFYFNSSLHMFQIGPWNTMQVVQGS